MSTIVAPTYSRKNPFPAPLLVNRLLTAVGAGKETRHYELSLAGSGLRYEVGDSLGVLPKNNPELVSEILEALHFSGEESITVKEGNQYSLREALETYYQITEPSRQFLEAVAHRSPDLTDLQELLEPDRKSDLERYLWGLQIIDFLLDSPSLHFTPEEFTGTLRKLQPRLYSIASSQRQYAEEVHLIVATVRYQSHGRSREGIASTFLAERLPIHSAVPVFVHVAKGFRLPDDPEAPVVMVGPGTGVAPFRAFLQDRRATGAAGKNWLIFGEQYSKTNFFYQDEMAEMQKQGVLHRLDTAFSRDQAHKIYVQHRILESGKELFAWLEAGGFFYVCGDAAHMAKDVDVALHEVVQKESGRTAEQAAEYIESLRKEKRYRRDVY